MYHNCCFQSVNCCQKVVIQLSFMVQSCRNCEHMYKATIERCQMHDFFAVAKLLVTTYLNQYNADTLPTLTVTTTKWNVALLPSLIWIHCVAPGSSWIPAPSAAVVLRCSATAVSKLVISNSVIRHMRCSRCPRLTLASTNSRTYPSRVFLSTYCFSASWTNYMWTVARFTRCVFRKSLHACMPYTFYMVTACSRWRRTPSYLIIAINSTILNCCNVFRVIGTVRVTW